LASGRAGGDKGTMIRVERRTSAPLWPFWLLVAAWICANCPQPGLYAVVSWFAEARTFSHQQRLTVQVAVLLGSDQAAAKPPPVVAAADSVAPPAAPLCPADAVVKKLPLQVENAGVGPRPSVAALRRRGGESAGTGIGRSPPPLGPPRVQVG
jgi:hypothetical protein